MKGVKKMTEIQKTKIQALTKYDIANFEGTTFSDPSKTDQTQRDETDIYRIIMQYGIQGRPEDIAKVPMAIDTRNLPKSLEEYQMMKKECDTYFATLPSTVRNKLENSSNLFSLIASGQNEMLQELNILERKDTNENVITEIKNNPNDSTPDKQTLSEEKGTI